MPSVVSEVLSTEEALEELLEEFEESHSFSSGSSASSSLASSPEFAVSPLSSTLSLESASAPSSSQKKKTVINLTSYKPRIVDTHEIIKPNNGRTTAPARTQSTVSPAPSTAIPVLEGFLWKQGAPSRMSIKSWKRRFFRLEDEGQCLCYYSTKQQNVLRGFIDLRQVTHISATSAPSSSKRYGLQICTPQRAYNILAETESQLAYWLNGLRIAKQQLSNSSSSSSSTTAPSLEKLSHEELLAMTRGLQQELQKTSQTLHNKERELESVRKRS